MQEVLSPTEGFRRMALRDDELTVEGIVRHVPKVTSSSIPSQVAVDYRWTMVKKAPTSNVKRLEAVLSTLKTSGS